MRHNWRWYHALFAVQDTSKRFALGRSMSARFVSKQNCKLLILRLSEKAEIGKSRYYDYAQNAPVALELLRFHCRGWPAGP